MTALLMIFGIFLFVMLVVVHEWGHFIAARRGGVDVEEFGIGFPPKIWSKKIGEDGKRFTFSVNLLPLGGFVRLKGENDSDVSKGSFGAAPIKTKVQIMLAGVVMNLIAAFFVLTILAAVGMPKIVDNQFSVTRDTKIIKDVTNKGSVLAGSVIKNSPAERAGVVEGDRILSLDSQVITSADQVVRIAKENAGKKVDIVVYRNGQEKSLQAQLNSENTGNGYLGIGSTSGQKGFEVRRSTWSSPLS